MINRSIAIQNQGGNKLIIDETNISSDLGIEYPRIVVPVQLDLSPIEIDSKATPFIITDIQDTLYIKDGRSKRKISEGNSTNKPEHVRQHGFPSHYKIEFPLDPKRIYSLEEFRNGKNMVFEITMRFSIVFTYFEQRRRLEQIVENVYFDSPLVIPQSHWVNRILPNLGVDNYFLVEIKKDEKILEKAWEYLEEAEKSFHNWKSKAIYANCRDLGTFLDKAIKEKYGSDSFTYKEKWGRGFNHFSSLGLHSEDTNKSNKYTEDEMQIIRPDAEHLLIVTKAQLKYAEELLRE